jgi:hypothetical protein
VISVTTGSADQFDPAVGMSSQGNFVVVYTEVFNSQSSVFARQYDSKGKLLKTTMVANNSFDPDVAVDADGNFVVSYTFNFSSTDEDVHARRYNAVGTQLGFTSVASTGLYDESESSVALTPSGGFVVAFHRVDSESADPNLDLLLRRYDAQGKLLATNGTINVASSSLDEGFADVGVDGSGNAVVAYERWTANGRIEVLAQRVTSFGTLGGLVQVSNPALSNFAYAPAIAVNRFGGGTFVVAYNQLSFGGSFRSEVAEVAGFSNVVTARHTDFAAGDENPSISMGDQGDYFVTYLHGTNDADLDVFGRRGKRT